MLSQNKHRRSKLLSKTPAKKKYCLECYLKQEGDRLGPKYVTLKYGKCGGCEINGMMLEKK